MAVGGDIVEITYNHPELGSGSFLPKANEDNTYDLGGIKTNDDANMVDGAGNPIWQKNRKLGFFQVVLANDQNQREDLEKIAALSAHVVPADWTFSIINGVTYGGKGKPVGDITGNINQATTPLKVAGTKFKKIAG